METVNKSTTANKIFYLILTLLILGSIGATFYRIVIVKDYQIVAETSCDPQTETGCYEWICDPAEDDTCPDAEEDRISYYKYISKKAQNIFLCEQTEEKLGCDEELACVEGEEDCEYTYCDPDTVGEDESCAPEKPDVSIE